MDTHDNVDKILDQWRDERPDLDVSPMGIFGRISRLARHIDANLKPVFDAHGLTAGEFDVLATLRRTGEPYQLTPTGLFKTVMLSSGAMTNRLNRLEAAGLVTRNLDPDDRRGSLVSLTPAGLDLIEQVVTDHIHNSHALLASYVPEDRVVLAQLLRKLLVLFENEE